MTIKFVLVLLYLLMGALLWGVGVKGIGGEAEYIRQIVQMQGCSYTKATILYTIALLVVIFFWPVMIIRGIRNK